jgi:hypothetical protein
VVSLALTAPAVWSAPLNAVNFDRMQGCGAAGTLRPLFFSTRLSEAAQRLADGVPLQAALNSSGYLAAESAALHISGATSDADIRRMLAAHYCSTVQDPRLKDFGVEQRGAEVWMVLAAPAPVPAPTDEVSIGRRLLELTNTARASGRRCGAKYFPPVGPLALDAALTRAMSRTPATWRRMMISSIGDTTAARRGCGSRAPDLAIIGLSVRTSRPAR